MGLSNRDVEELVKEIAGQDTVALVQLIKNKKNVSEFKLAEKLKVTVNEVRNRLYRLHAHNLVSFIRKKDKKKGWYIYYWTFDDKHARDLILNLKRKRLAELRGILEEEKQSNFFSCPNKCVRLSFESAMEDQFRCPECNQVLLREDNIKKIEGLGKEIKEIEDELRARQMEEIEAAKKAKEKPARKIKKKPAKRKIKKRPVKKRTKKKKRIKRKVRKKPWHKKAKKRKKKLSRKKKKAKRKPKRKTKKRRKR